MEHLSAVLPGQGVDAGASDDEGDGEEEEEEEEEAEAEIGREHEPEQDNLARDTPSGELAM